MAMPWSKAKQKIRDYESGARDVAQLTALFDACFRIQREASAAAGRHIPMVVENVRGAQRWVGRAAWHFGSFYLWGDVPALMPIAQSRAKVAGFRFDGSGRSFQSAAVEATGDGVKVSTMGAGWYPKGHPKHVPGLAFNGHAERGIKQRGSGREWFAGEGTIGRTTSSKSPARKMASAMIAKIPLVLSRHVAASWRPDDAAIQRAQGRG